jgi:hypothetical protein
MDKAAVLRAAFLAGATVDAGALLPMLVPTVAREVWGVDDTSWGYRFAMGYGASLMAGWTLLLIWAARSPLERRVVALLTVLVITGLIVTEIIGVAFGWLHVGRMLPIWCLQALLLTWLAWAYQRSGRSPVNGSCRPRANR